MFNPIDTINLLDGLNINPIPLEMGQAMTTTKWLMAIQAKVNEIIILRNDILSEAENYTNIKNNQVIQAIEDLKELLNTGDIIPNGSIGLDKLKSDFLNTMNDVVTNMVHDIAKTVWFGINDNGYFYAVIPSDWQQINFDTTQEGNLILQY
jgi:hypothetical protein